MKKYKIFRRGHLYRVASPGWLFWNWAHDIGYDDYGIFQTSNYGEALAKMNAENASAKKWATYHTNDWTEVK